MELFIKEVRWAQNRVTGKKTETPAADLKIPLKTGIISEFSSETKIFAIDEIGGDYIVLAIRYPNNPSFDQTLKILKDEQRVYAPTSFGAGYKYYINLKEGKDNE